MMPGHEDREDLGHPGLGVRLRLAAMMPGHEDREDRRATSGVGPCSSPPQ